MATAFGGGPNVAYGLIQSAIDRNVRAQIVNQQHNRALIAHQANFVHTIRGLSKDQMQYENYLRIGLTAMAMNRFNVIRSNLGEAQARLVAQDVSDRLGAAFTEAQIKAITALQQKVTFKFKTIAEYNQARAAFAGATQQSTSPQQGGAPLAARGRRAGGGGELSLPTEGTPEQRAQTISDQFKRLSEGGANEAQLAQLQKRVVEQLNASGDSVVSANVANIGKEVASQRYKVRKRSSFCWRKAIQGSRQPKVPRPESKPAAKSQVGCFLRAVQRSGRQACL